MNHRFRILIPVLGALAVVAAAAWWSFQASVSALATASSDTELCARLAAEISELRELPQFAAVEGVSIEATFEVIRQAAEQAQVGSRAIARIQPDDPVRLSGTPYRIRPLRINLDEVSMQQLVSFAHYLVDTSRGLTVRDLRLSRPSGDQASGPRELWNVQLTLTQLIFSPNSRQSTSTPTSLNSPRLDSPLNETAHPLAAVSAAAAGTRRGRGL